MKALYLSILLLPGILSSVTVLADEGEQYCIEAQRVLAGTELTGKLNVHTGYDSFVESKPTSEPLELHAYLSNPVSGTEGLFKTLSCKMRTAERLNAAYAEGERSAAKGDSDCRIVQQDMLRRVKESIPAEQLRQPALSIVVDEEERTYMGPSWLKGWPFEPVTLAPDGKVHLKTRALYAPNSWWMPLPERFLGNYYCHLASPGYLEALLRGTVSR